MPLLRLSNALLLGLILVGAGCPPSEKEQADPWDAEAARLRKRLGPTFRVKPCTPFVVAGNLDADFFERICTHTIAESRDALWRDFFTRRPGGVIRVYLFRDAKTYQQYARLLFKEKPISPYGYYVPGEERLMMNIATGGGTLVHEMTHALMRPDFPMVPKWFDEGLASLFEQCVREDGSLRGLVNWRLPRLQEAIRLKELVALRDLVATTREQFCGPLEDLHYAEARYLCMYMQEHGLLKTFYQRFRDGCTEDPTGAETLRAVFGKPLDEIQKEWIAWAKNLKWP